MLTARMYFVLALGAIVSLLGQSRVRADYMSVTVPLNSQDAGPNVGNVVAQANDGSTTVNGLLPGQVRLTFTVNPVSAYTQNGSSVGFTSVLFYTDLPITASQITAPPGWFAMPPVGKAIASKPREYCWGGG